MPISARSITRFGLLSFALAEGIRRRCSPTYQNAMPGVASPTKGNPMSLHRSGMVIVAGLALLLLPSQAAAQWSEGLWASSYNIVVRPESDTVTVPASGSANLNIYVQNNMGYQLPNFKLSANSDSATISLTSPVLKVPGTLLPGQKGRWGLYITKSGGGSVSIQDITFSVLFGNEGQSTCYPTTGANAVMVVQTDGTLFPPPPPPGLDNPQSSCDLAQGRSLQYEAVADFEDVAAGLDKLMQLYCSGRASWGPTDGVSLTYCKDTLSYSCPTAKPSSGTGSKYDYMHLWAAGELAARKAALGARTAVLRSRLQCGVNDGDEGFAGYALFMLGYLGEDASARSFIESQIFAGGDKGTIAKAAILLMGSADDITKYKADVQAGLKSSSTFVAATCAAALGIADNDDASVTGTLLPLVQWVEPDTSDDGKGMFASHLLALVTWDRRGWAPNGADTGGVSFYGDPPYASGGSAATGGATGSGGATGGATASGGAAGTGGNGAETGGATPASGGATDVVLADGGGSSTGGAADTGGAIASGGTPDTGGTSSYFDVVGGAGSGGTPESGGAFSGTGSLAHTGGTSGTGGTVSSGGTLGNGGTGGSHCSGYGTYGTGGGGIGGSSLDDETTFRGYRCDVGGRAQGRTSNMYVLFMAGLALMIRRRRNR